MLTALGSHMVRTVRAMELAIALVLGVAFLFVKAVELMNRDRDRSGPSWLTTETEWKECPACKGEGGTGKYNLCCLYCLGAGGALVTVRSEGKRG